MSDGFCSGIHPFYAKHFTVANLKALLTKCFLCVNLFICLSADGKNESLNYCTES